MNKNRQEAAKKAAQSHKVNMQRRLQHRLEVARANGDDALVRQLEAEAKYIG
ncbi:MAG: hypothetical protein MUF49_08105 [Oculatellaceae cyanobacterium Prado106]|nr:hypothetical protein [Oculatellaceae cyanobacterium Prado106]